jgi:hypothetical protein
MEPSTFLLIRKTPLQPTRFLAVEVGTRREVLFLSKASNSEFIACLQFGSIEAYEKHVGSVIVRSLVAVKA